jgi:antagonist of KipI
MIEVVEPGALTSVQTADGRPGWRHLGIPVGGAADAWSARLANRLVGNPDDAALLELTLSGPKLWFDAETAIALTGADFEATLDGLPLPPFVGRPARVGSLLRIGIGNAARGYLAVSGGIKVPPVLGSMSTDLPTGFGGLEGRALRAGDRLTVGPPSGSTWRWTGRKGATGPIRFLPGPHHASLDAAALTEGRWVVGTEADRAGVRLDGHLLAAGEREVASMGLPIGSIQVPPDGRPIVMLADRPVTGGYPVPACVIRADVGRVAGLRTGDRLTFASVSREEAVDALGEMENELAALGEAGAAPDDGLGWAGAHG